MPIMNVFRLHVIYKVCALDNVAWLSQWIHIAGTVLGHSSISFKNCRSHFTSSLALSKAINFDSIVEWVIHVCLKDF